MRQNRSTGANTCEGKKKSRGKKVTELYHAFVEKLMKLNKLTELGVVMNCGKFYFDRTICFDLIRCPCDAVDIG
jgi:hypothetical protein